MSRPFSSAELRERLTRWENRDPPLAPLSEVQRNSSLDLHVHDEDPLPDLVSSSSVYGHVMLE